MRMFGDTTRIAYDATERTSHDHQVAQIGRYTFDLPPSTVPCPVAASFGSNCPVVGPNGAALGQWGRAVSTTSNEPGERHISSALVRRVPYKVGGGVNPSVPETDVSRALGNANEAKNEKYYHPRTELLRDVTNPVVEEFVRGGISTRACYRNAKKKFSASR